MRIIDDKEILRVVSSFEEATISREEWKHVEHMIVGLYYIDKFGFDLAVEKMRLGILNLLETGFKLDLAKEMPYHETITRFWLVTLHSFIEASKAKSLADMTLEVIGRYDKNYPLRFYSRELLFSDEARRTYVEPDLKVNPEPASAQAPMRA